MFAPSPNWFLSCGLDVSSDGETCAIATRSHVTLLHLSSLRFLGSLVPPITKGGRREAGVSTPMRITAVGFGRHAADLNSLYTGSADKSLRKWDFRKRRVISGHGNHQTEVTSLSVATTGPFVASGDRSGRLHVWKSTSGQCGAVGGIGSSAISALSWNENVTDDKLLLLAGLLNGSLVLFGVCVPADDEAPQVSRLAVVQDTNGAIQSISWRPTVGGDALGDAGKMPRVLVCGGKLLVRADFKQEYEESKKRSRKKKKKGTSEIHDGEGCDEETTGVETAALCTAVSEPPQTDAKGSVSNSWSAFVCVSGKDGMCRIYRLSGAPRWLELKKLLVVARAASESPVKNDNTRHAWTCCRWLSCDDIVASSALGKLVFWRTARSVVVQSLVVHSRPVFGIVEIRSEKSCSFVSMSMDRTLVGTTMRDWGNAASPSPPRTKWRITGLGGSPFALDVVAIARPHSTSSSLASAAAAVDPIAVGSSNPTGCTIFVGCGDGSIRLWSPAVGFSRSCWKGIENRRVTALVAHPMNPSRGWALVGLHDGGVTFYDLVKHSFVASRDELHPAPVRLCFWMSVRRRLYAISLGDAGALRSHLIPHHMGYSEQDSLDGRIPVDELFPFLDHREDKIGAVEILNLVFESRSNEGDDDQFLCTSASLCAVVGFRDRGGAVLGRCGCRDEPRLSVESKSAISTIRIGVIGQSNGFQDGKGDPDPVCALCAMGDVQGAISVANVSKFAFAARSRFAPEGEEVLPAVEVDVDSSLCSIQLHGHTEAISALAWDPLRLREFTMAVLEPSVEGSRCLTEKRLLEPVRLASASFDGTVRLWEVSVNSEDGGDSACLGIYRGHYGRVLSLLWTRASDAALRRSGTEEVSSSTVCISGGEDHCVRLWRPEEVEDAVSTGVVEDDESVERSTTTRKISGREGSSSPSPLLWGLNEPPGGGNGSPLSSQRSRNRRSRGRGGGDELVVPCVLVVPECASPSTEGAEEIARLLGRLAAASDIAETASVPPTDELDVNACIDLARQWGMAPDLLSPDREKSQRIVEELVADGLHRSKARTMRQLALERLFIADVEPQRLFDAVLSLSDTEDDMFWELLAPSVELSRSPLWMHMVARRAHSMSNRDPWRSALLLLAADNDVKGAISVLCNAGLAKEAVVVARARCLMCDPLVSQATTLCLQTLKEKQQEPFFALQLSSFLGWPGLLRGLDDLLSVAERPSRANDALSVKMLNLIAQIVIYEVRRRNELEPDLVAVAERVSTCVAARCSDGKIDYSALEWVDGMLSVASSPSPPPDGVPVPLVWCVRAWRSVEEALGLLPRSGGGGDGRQDSVLGSLRFIFEILVRKTSLEDVNSRDEIDCVDLCDAVRQSLSTSVNEAATRHEVFLHDFDHPRTRRWILLSQMLCGDVKCDAWLELMRKEENIRSRWVILLVAISSSFSGSFSDFLERVLQDFKNGQEVVVQDSSVISFCALATLTLSHLSASVFPRTEELVECLGRSVKVLPASWEQAPGLRFDFLKLCASLLPWSKPSGLLTVVDEVVNVLCQESLSVSNGATFESLRSRFDQCR